MLFCCKFTYLCHIAICIDLSHWILSIHSCLAGGGGDSFVPGKIVVQHALELRNLNLSQSQYATILCMFLALCLSSDYGVMPSAVSVSYASARINANRTSYMSQNNSANICIYKMPKYKLTF